MVLWNSSLSKIMAKNKNNINFCKKNVKLIKYALNKNKSFLMILNVVLMIVIKWNTKKKWKGWSINEHFSI